MLVVPAVARCLVESSRFAPPIYTKVIESKQMAAVMCFAGLVD